MNARLTWLLFFVAVATGVAVGREQWEAAVFGVAAGRHARASAARASASRPMSLAGFNRGQGG